MVDVNKFLKGLKMFTINFDDKDFVEGFERRTNMKVKQDNLTHVAFAMLCLGKHDGIYYDIEEEIDITKSKVIKFPVYVDIITNITCDFPIYLYIQSKNQSIKMNSLPYVNFACMDRKAIFTINSDGYENNTSIKIKYTCCLLNNDFLQKLLPHKLIMYPLCYENAVANLVTQELS
jgi:hypothetical protein